MIAAARRNIWLPFGADGNGRDLLARMMIAGRISLAVGLLGCSVALVIGVAYGADRGLRRRARRHGDDCGLVDVLYALPFMFFVILLVAFFGRHFALIFIAIGAVEWLDMARLVRGQTINLERREFVLAARALGVAPSAILIRHIAPNLIGVIAAFLALTGAEDHRCWRASSRSSDSACRSR